MDIDAIIDLIYRYLNLLQEYESRIHRVVLFGSYARGEADAHSDIDLLVLSPDFDRLTWQQEESLWALTAQVDTRIEPIPCGLSRWRNDTVAPLLDVVRQEGIIIDVDSTMHLHPAPADFGASP